MKNKIFDLLCKLPRVGSYVYFPNSGGGRRILYIWLFNRKWELPLWVEQIFEHLKILFIGTIWVSIILLIAASLGLLLFYFPIVFLVAVIILIIYWVGLMVTTGWIRQ